MLVVLERRPDVIWWSVRFMATVSAGDEPLEGWGGQETKDVVGR